MPAHYCHPPKTHYVQLVSIITASTPAPTLGIAQRKGGTTDGSCCRGNIERRVSIGASKLARKILKRLHPYDLHPLTRFNQTYTLQCDKQHATQMELWYTKINRIWEGNKESLHTMRTWSSKGNPFSALQIEVLPDPAISSATKTWWTRVSQSMIVSSSYDLLRLLLSARQQREFHPPCWSAPFVNAQTKLYKLSNCAHHRCSRNAKALLFYHYMFGFSG